MKLAVLIAVPVLALAGGSAAYFGLDCGEGCIFGGEKASIEPTQPAEISADTKDCTGGVCPSKVDVKQGCAKAAEVSASGCEKAANCTEAERKACAEKAAKSGCPKAASRCNKKQAPVGVTQ